MAKKKMPSFTTPAGTFRFPKLTKPDYGTDEHPKPEGEYNVKLLLPRDVADEWLEKSGLTQMQDEAVAAGKKAHKELPKAKREANPFKVHPLYGVDYDEDEKETGLVVMNFKMKASGVSKKDGSKWKRKPAIFDAKGKLMKGIDSIWGGTTGKVSFSSDAFFTMAAGAGLAKYLNAVQIIDLVSSGTRSASSYGFGEEEGYEYDEAEWSEDEDNDAENSDTEDGDDSGEEDF